MMVASLNRDPLDWTDEGTQTFYTQVCKPFMRSIQRTVVADIEILMATASIDVKNGKVDIRFYSTRLQRHYNDLLWES